MLFSEWLQIESKEPVTINRDLDKWFDRAEGLKGAVKELQDALDKQKKKKPKPEEPESKEKIKEKDDKVKHPAKPEDRDGERHEDDEDQRDEPEVGKDGAEEQPKKVKIPPHVMDGIKGKKPQPPQPLNKKYPDPRNRFQA